jgi:hypothetical protein
MTPTDSLAPVDLHGLNKPVPLKAGPVSMIFVGGDLRYLKLGDHEVVRRIYAAVRDHNWNTVAGEMSELVCETSEEGFQISYVSTHRQGDVHFVWRALIAGDERGAIRFEFDGEAKTTFLRNRIGLCLLHPIDECAGRPCRVLHPDGRLEEACFPGPVAREQPVTGLSNLACITYEIRPGLDAEIRFEGDVFETEDQRNWIDASFKTYCTPLKEPFPVEIPAGTRIRQSVTLRLVGDVPAAFASGKTRSEAVAVRIVPEVSERMPDIGLGVASHGGSLSPRETERLVRLGLTHLRVDLRLAGEDWAARLRSAARDAFELGVALELAIHLQEQGEEGFAAIAKELSRMKVDLTRALIFRDGSKSTPADDLDAARAYLEEFGMAIGAGTDADLYQLNLQPPPADADFLCWSMNPQVHASDILSISETPAAAAWQIASMHQYYENVPLVVSPITLKPRFNPVATGVTPAQASDELPPQVDPRQMSLFAACWTLAMYKACAESRVDSLTFFETTGWRGVMESERGSSLPEKFPSAPCEVFPLYHVFADIAGFAGGRVIKTVCDDPLSIASLLLARDDRSLLLLANLGAVPRIVDVSAFPEFRDMRRMTPANMELAKLSPDRFRRQTEGFDGHLVELPPFAIARLIGPAIASAGALP